MRKNNSRKYFMRLPGIVRIIIILLLLNFVYIPFGTGNRDLSKSNIKIFSSELFAQTPENKTIQDKTEIDKKPINQEKDNNESVLMKVMLVVLFIWFGIAIYLFSIDRKIKKLEKNINEI